MESSLSMGEAIIFLALFSQNYRLRVALSLLFLAPTVNDIRRKLHIVKIHSTVGKRAKRTPDATDETTYLNIFLTYFSC